MPSTIKISQLPSASNLSNSTIFPIVQGSSTQQVTLAQISSFVSVTGPAGPQGPAGANVTILRTNAISSTPGNITISHSLGSIPNAVIITMTCGGQMWLNTGITALGYDASNVYCIATDANVTAQIYVIGG